jgi:hypothetical protein
VTLSLPFSFIILSSEFVYIAFQEEASRLHTGFIRLFLRTPNTSLCIKGTRSASEPVNQQKGNCRCTEAAAAAAAADIDNSPHKSETPREESPCKQDGEEQRMAASHDTTESLHQAKKHHADLWFIVDEGKIRPDERIMVHGSEGAVVVRVVVVVRMISC